MGDGLKRASLAALCTRGPWMGGEGDELWELTGEELRAYFMAIQSNQKYPSSVLKCIAGDRKVDRANQLLRKAGLIVFSGKGKDRKWRTTLTAGTWVMG